MRELFHPKIEQISLASLLYALGDPVRLEIVRRLAEQGEQPCSSLCCGVPKSTLSHHFKVLREAGVVFSRKEGTQRLNSLRKAELDGRFPGLMDGLLAVIDPAPPRIGATIDLLGGQAGRGREKRSPPHC
ncbi:MAG: helix-turn-helix transcriptional regulator [Synechococcales cyanobacterium RM1_1_8]|nr:helix-turn-helix transcriptional regulator [Synechococcales cyanobacterium RM1_1_8]